MSQRAFAAGAISQLFLVISAFSLMTLGDFTGRILSRELWLAETLFPNSFLLFGTHGGSLLLVSALLILVSLATIVRHLRVSWGSVIGPVLGLLAAATEILLFTTGFRPNSYYSTAYGVFYAATQGIVNLVLGGYILQGLAMMMVGVFFLKYRDRFSNPRLWTVTGATYFCSAVFALIYFFFLPTLAWTAMALCGVIGTWRFLLSRPARE